MGKVSTNRKNLLEGVDGVRDITETGHKKQKFNPFSRGQYLTSTTKDKFNTFGKANGSIGKNSAGKNTKDNVMLNFDDNFSSDEEFDTLNQKMSKVDRKT